MQIFSVDGHMFFDNFVMTSQGEIVLNNSPEFVPLAMAAGHFMIDHPDICLDFKDLTLHIARQLNDEDFISFYRKISKPHEMIRLIITTNHEIGLRLARYYQDHGPIQPK